MTTAAGQERFQTLIDEHKGILYKVCNSYCANRDDREDLVQEIVMQLWRSFRSFDGRCRFTTWMYRVALNVAISFSRREAVRTRHLAPGACTLLEVADETARDLDDIRLLYQCIGRLDALNRGLLLLYLDG